MVRLLLIRISKGRLYRAWLRRPYRSLKGPSQCTAQHGVTVQYGVMPCTEEVCYGTNEVGTF
jgi:hypothetical protein